MVGLIKEYIDICKGHSTYCRAIRDYDVTDEHLLSFKQGDIIYIKEKGTQVEVKKCE